MNLRHLTEQIGKYVTGSLPAIESESSPQSSDTLVEGGPSQEEEEGESLVGIPS